jgi:hypothetical protein
MATKRIAAYNKVADQKWIEQNRQHRSYLSSRSSARSFIKNKATLEDLVELEKLILERRERLGKFDGK